MWGKLWWLRVSGQENFSILPETRTRIQLVVRLEGIKNALSRTYGDVVRNHTTQMAAALSYYFVLSLFPALIFLSAVVAYLPVPDLFGQALGLMARFIPPDSMGLVRRILADVVTPNRGAFLSFGILGALWAASGGFSAARSEERRVGKECRCRGAADRWKMK